MSTPEDTYNKETAHDRLKQELYRVQRELSDARVAWNDHHKKHCAINQSLREENADLKVQLTDLRGSYKLREDVIRNLQSQLTENYNNIHQLGVDISLRDKKIKELENKILEYISMILVPGTAKSPSEPPDFPDKLGLNKPEKHDFAMQLRGEMNEIYDMLMTKNKSYGNSALDPVRVFSSASPVEQILVRIDDKLSRVKRGAEFQGEDTIRDLIGYFFLFLQAKRSACPVKQDYESGIESNLPSNH